jgi:hypothetical protein
LCSSSSSLQPTLRLLTTAAGSFPIALIMLRSKSCLHHLHSYIRCNLSRLPKAQKPRLNSELVLNLKLVGYPCVATDYNNTHVNYPLKRFQVFIDCLRSLHNIFYERTSTIGSKLETSIPCPPISRFCRAGGEGKRRAYLFVAGEGHNEDLGIWRRYR